jgi:hypothetical protein
MAFRRLIDFPIGALRPERTLYCQGMTGLCYRFERARMAASTCAQRDRPAPGTASVQCLPGSDPTDKFITRLDINTSIYAK